MNALVDTCVWSHAFRRDRPKPNREVELLEKLIDNQDIVLTTGLIIQELLQGFSGPRHRDLIIRHFQALPIITPTTEDHVTAAQLRNTCRRKGITVGTIDALIAQLCINRGVSLLTSDKDFLHIARASKLELL